MDNKYTLTASNNYILGHTDREHRRLTFQASLHNPFTEQFLRRAGLSSGMSSSPPRDANPDRDLDGSQEPE
jgi:hypothetical protein